MMIGKNDVFEIVDIEGKDNFSEELENICKNRIGNAVDFIL